MSINLKEMTIKEKLIAMELLWDDLCENQANISSPDWHRNILNERENALNKGKDRFVDFEEAKLKLLASTK